MERPCLCETCCNKECSKRVNQKEWLVEKTIACSYYKAPTNADRIRAMSDEELAKFFDEKFERDCPFGAKLCLPTCTECYLEWLQQPAREVP